MCEDDSGLQQEDTHQSAHGKLQLALFQGASLLSLGSPTF